ncbi:MAG: hypothetical protein F4W93_06720 [Dehalococcoidia bacterium]|nr:hypothetical protein [Dehalococcoidia bacterium]
MKKDSSNLPPDIQAHILELAEKPEDETNTDDIPEVLDWSSAKRGVFVNRMTDEETTFMTEQ